MYCRNFFPLVCLTVISLLIVTPSLSAETNNPTADSRPYLVMGNAGKLEYSKTGGLRASGTRSELDKKDFAQKLFRTTPQALREIPGVMVQETAHGQGSPIIRGFTGYHNLMTVDGIRLNNSVFRSGPNQYWNTIDPYVIERLEISKGTAGVRGGSDAIGGSVNAVTLNPFTYDAPWRTAGASSYRVSSAENSHIGRAEFRMPFNKELALLAGATVKQFGDLIGGKDTGRQPNTGYDEWDLDLKLEHRYRENARLTLAYQNTRLEDVPRTHRTVFARSFAGTTIGTELQRSTDQQRQLAYVQLRLDDAAPWLDEWTTSLSWHRQVETRFRVRPAPIRTDLQGFTVDTLGLWSNLKSTTSIAQFEYGFDYYHDEVDSFSTASAIQGPVADDAAYDLAGIYLQGIRDIAAKLDFALGGRYQYAAASAGSVRDPVTTLRTSLSDDWHAAVGFARLRWKIQPDRLTWHSGVSQGFRAPNLSDLTRFDTARSSEQEIAAPGLKPEHYLTWETGLSYQHTRFQADLSGYYTRIDNQIVRFPTGAITAGGDTIVTKANVGDGYVHGVEFSAALDLTSAWTVFGNLAWLEGQVDTFPTAAALIRREYLDRMMPFTGEIGIRWHSANDKWWTESVMMMAAKADKLSTRDTTDSQRIPPGGTPEYAVWHWRGGWRINHRFNTSVAIENILDEDYRIHGSGQNMPGRNFVLELRASF